MKTRSSFVSNSSSSSFIVLCKKTDYDKIVKKYSNKEVELSEEEKEDIEEDDEEEESSSEDSNTTKYKDIFKWLKEESSTSKKFMGEDVICFGTLSVSDCYPWEEEFKFDPLDKLIDLLKKEKIEYFSHSIG